VKAFTLTSDKGGGSGGCDAGWFAGVSLAAPFLLVRAFKRAKAPRESKRS
jgi:hypothetical protein